MITVLFERKYIKIFVCNMTLYSYEWLNRNIKIVQYIFVLKRHEKDKIHNVDPD